MKNLVFILVAVSTFFLTSCGDAGRVESLTAQLKTVRRDNINARNNLHRCSRELEIANREVETAQQKIDSIPILESTAVEEYKEGVRAQANALKMNGVMEIPITRLDPRLNWASWPEIQEGLSVLKSGNQLRNARTAFNYIFFSAQYPDGTSNYDSYFIQNNVWEGLKTAVKDYPEKVEKVFNAVAPLLKVFKNTEMGDLVGVTHETKELLNRKFSAELSQKFLDIYNSVDNTYKDNYLDKLNELQKNGAFEKWGYERVGSKHAYEFYNSKIIADYMDWVWLYEYRDALPALKRMVAKIDTW